MEQRIKTNTKTYKAAIYLRLSRDDELQGESGSISTQRQMLTQYCRENRFDIFDEYVDDGYSGTNFDRPDFQRMIDDIEDGKVNCVITKDLSRLGRNYILTGQYTDFYFPSKGVRYIAVNDGVDSDKGESEIAPFLNILNEMHARQTSKKVKAALRTKFADGMKFNPYAPFGYIKDPDILGHIIPDDETKHIVEEMFDMASLGKGAAAIRSELDKRKIPIPAWWIYKRSGMLSQTFKDQPEDRRHKWTVEMVKRILSNPVYLGHSVHYRQTNISFKNKKKVHRPEEDWYTVENTHEPIISQELWDAAQAHIRSRKRPTKQGEVQIFAGLLRCVDCGRSLRYSHKKAKDGTRTQEYYSCNTYKEYGKERCSIHSVKYKTLYEIVYTKLKRFASLAESDKEALIGLLTKESSGQRERDISQSKKELARAEKRQRSLDNTFAKLYEDRLSGKVTERNFSMLSERYQNEQAELDTKITELKAKIEENVQTEKNVGLWVDLIGKYADATELTAPMLNDLIDKIAVHEAVKDENGGRTQKIEIYYRFIGKVE